jgi:hypothetical protein
MIVGEGLESSAQVVVMSHHASSPLRLAFPMRSSFEQGCNSPFYSQSHPLRKPGIKKNKLGIFQGELRNQ